MPRDYTTDGLIEGVRRRGMIASNAGGYTSDHIIAVADDELVDRIVPIVFGLKAEHFRTYADTTTVADQLAYPIPDTALHRTIISASWVDSAGKESPLTSIDFDAEIDSSARPTYPEGAFYLSDDDLILYPSVEGGRTLRIHYYRLTNQLVATSAAAEVLSVDTDTGVVTCSSVPAAWTTADALCVVSGRPGFRLRFESELPTDVSSPTVTFDPTLVQDIQVGDWIALEGESPIAQIPAEAHPVLAQAVVAKLLEGFGDPKLNTARADLVEIIAAYRNLGTPRVTKSPKKLIDRNRLVHHLP